MSPSRTGSPDPETIMQNYQLYARVLRLWHMCDHPSMDWHGNCGIEGIVRAVILPDTGLVWC